MERNIYGVILYMVVESTYLFIYGAIKLIDVAGMAEPGQMRRTQDPLA